MRIGYTVIDCTLGWLLIGATGKGVCAVYLGDSEEELESELRKKYPAAEIPRKDWGLGPLTRALLKCLDGTQPHVDLPLDVQATAFQQRVWEELMSIPRRDAYLRRDRTRLRPVHGGAGGCASLRYQPGLGRGSVPPGSSGGRRARRLPVGPRAQEGATRRRARSSPRRGRWSGRFAGGSCPGNLRSGRRKTAEHAAQHLHASLVEGAVFFDNLQVVWGPELRKPSGRGAGAHHRPYALEQGPNLVHAI